MRVSQAHEDVLYFKYPPDKLRMRRGGHFLPHSCSNGRHSLYAFLLPAVILVTAMSHGPTEA